jgi:hypothetical protein
MDSDNMPGRCQQWREGESSPATGNLSARPAGKPGSLFAKERLRRSLLRHCPVATAKYTERSVCVFKAWRNLSGPIWLQGRNQTSGQGRAASRRPTPCPSKGTRREGRAPSHRPQMSSDRLFLDRVARQHCPSPLHRHGQTNTASHQPPSKQDISTLQGIGHFYFALTEIPNSIQVQSQSLPVSFPWSRQKLRACSGESPPASSWGWVFDGFSWLSRTSNPFSGRVPKISPRRAD